MRKGVFLALSALLLLPSCSRVKGGADQGSLVFSHTQHAEQAGCTDCHAGVGQSAGPTTGRFIPSTHKGCSECHEVDSGCDKCHRGAREGVRLGRRDRRLRFSHAAHKKKVKSCDACHPRSRQGGASIPGHGTCNVAGCHRRAFAALTCNRCHIDLQRRRRQTLAQISHGPGFARSHGTLARQGGGRACAQCHDQTYCATCHAPTAAARASILFPEEVERQFIHRGDYVSRHVVEARSDPRSCRKCHGQLHCRSCHALSGLAAATDENLPGGRTRSAHPPGWMVPGSATFHGQKARQDIGRCASCHDRGANSNCVSCHKVGGIGGNPHPAAWSWRDKAAQCRSTAMCATCHTGGQGCP